jgi:hypothetical protein
MSYNFITFQPFTKSSLLYNKYLIFVQPTRGYSTIFVVVYSKCNKLFVHSLSIFSFNKFNMTLSTCLRDIGKFSQTFMNCTTTSTYNSLGESTTTPQASMMVFHNSSGFTCFALASLDLIDMTLTSNLHLALTFFLNIILTH